MKTVCETNLLGNLQNRSVESFTSLEGCAVKTRFRDGSECIAKIELITIAGDSIRVRGYGLPESRSLDATHFTYDFDPEFWGGVETVKDNLLENSSI